MGKRREGREAAVQFLYQLDLNAGASDEMLPRFWPLRATPTAERPTEKVRVFTEALIAGVLQHREEIDARIAGTAANYQLGRIAAVDRNILRVAIYEMLHCTDVPPIVSINEAIEIAKKFGSEESKRFVNGILDRIRGELTRPSREAIAPASR